MDFNLGVQATGKDRGHSITSIKVILNAGN
jgi:hypothetical protein